MKLTSKEIEAITALPGQKRYEHFIKVIADWEEAWGLYKDGWALAASDDGREIFPLWPAKEYAALCAQDKWAGFEPEPIPLEDLMNELLPKLQEDRLLTGIFYLPSNQGITPSIEQLLSDLRAELKNYE
jgi:Protein of unknown function (DUF2750)